MRDWGVDSSGVVYADSSAALAIANRKGAGKLRHINISCLWIQEKQDLHQLEMRKVLGTENPADLMTKYLTRSVMDTHLEYLSQRRESGRARSGLNIQGKNAPGNAKPSTVAGDVNSICLEDNWKVQASSHQVWPTRWTGETQFEATDGSWQRVRHIDQRRALMTPKRVRSLELPSGVEWTGKRRTVIHPVDCEEPKGFTRPVNNIMNACTDTESDASDPEMPALVPLTSPEAHSARAVLAKLNSKARTEPEDQPTIFNDEEQGHKRRVQSRRESTPRR